MRATRLIVALVVLALVAGTVLAALAALGSDDPGGGGDGSGRTLAPTPSPQPGATEPPTADLADFYAQTIDWELCSNRFECATLTVPLDYADPGGDTIELALLKDPADNLDERVGSLVVNPGGPGAPGTSYAQQSSFAFRDPIRDAFDIIGFDPRGTGRSDPVDCLSDEGVDALAASDPDPDTPEEGQELEQRYEDFWQGCADNSDALIGHVTTAEAARDMDVLRAALGEAQLLYFGASYGTKLGATYAELFPDQVGRLVLDGAVDVSLGRKQLDLEQAGGFEVALRSYVQACVDSRACFLGGSLDDGLARIQDFIAAVEDEPLPSYDDVRELSVGNAFYGLVAPLYNEQYWPILDEALGAALGGDGTMLLRLSDVYTSRNPDGSYADNSAEAILAINCLDDPFSVPADEVPGQVADYVAASPTFGEVFAWGLVNCRGIQTERSEPAPVIDGAGAAPIVVIGTTRDPATPYQWAVALADQLESGVLVSRDGDGHTGYNAGNGCVDEAVESYLVDGTVPADGLEC